MISSAFRAGIKLITGGGSGSSSGTSTPTHRGHDKDKKGDKKGKSETAAAAGHGGAGVGPTPHPPAIKTTGLPASLKTASTDSTVSYSSALSQSQSNPTTPTAATHLAAQKPTVQKHS